MDSLELVVETEEVTPKSSIAIVGSVPTSIPPSELVATAACSESLA
jgi:hypothetical protein